MPRYGGYDSDEPQKRDRYLKGDGCCEWLRHPCASCAWANFKTGEGPCLDCTHVDVKTRGEPKQEEGIAK